MSKTRMRQMVEQEIVTATRCDVCGKVINGDDPEGWHHFDSSHNDWGNDSIDSWDSWDACSFACYVTKVREVFEDYGDGSWGHKTLRVDGKDWAFVHGMLKALDAERPREAPGK